MKQTNNQEILKEQILDIAVINYKFIYKMCEDMKKSDKRVYKSISSGVDKRIKQMQNIRPSYENPKNNFLMGLYYVLDMPSEIEYFITSIDERGNADLRVWLRDKEFKIFYKKVLIVLTYIEKERNSLTLSDTELEYYTYFLSTKAGVLFTYFLNKEETITVEKVKSFLSKVFDWKSMIIDFSTPLTSEQEIIFDEIKTGIKYLKLKGAPIRNNVTYKKTQQYNVLDDMKNNITIKYISAQNYKHRFHKLPKRHWREGHWRYYENGTKIWIEGRWLGGNDDYLEVA